MGKNQEALDFYNQKLAGNSTDYASYITRGKILVKLGRYDDAINDFYKASKLDNSQSTYMLYKGLVTMQSAVDINALDALNLSGTENMDMLTFYQCALLYQLNKINEAGICLNKLLAIDNNNPQGNFLKAMTLSRAGKYEDSIKYFNKAEQGWLNTEELRVNKWFALAKSDFTWAIDYLDKALTLNADSTGALYAKAFALLQTKSYKDGIKLIDKAIALSSKNKDYYILRGDLMMRISNYGQAIASYDNAFLLDSKDSTILAKKALAQHKAWNIKDSNTTLVETKSLIPNNANKYIDFSIILTMMWKYDDAIIYADKTLALVPNSSSAKFNKALTFYLLGKLSDADVRYHNLRGDKMMKNEAKLVLANYKITNADFGGAYALIKEMLKTDPKDEMALATKVKLYGEMTTAGKVPEKGFDYTTPQVVSNATTKLNKYWFLKNYK